MAKKEFTEKQSLAFKSESYATAPCKENSLMKKKLLVGAIIVFTLFALYMAYVYAMDTIYEKPSTIAHTISN